MIPIISIVGTSNSGKTTLLEKLISELKSRRYRVAVVKHDVHGFNIDHKGKDSWRLKHAGAEAVVISSGTKVAVIQDVDRDHSLNELRARIPFAVDIILSEGYKSGPHPKIEVFRKGHRKGLLCGAGDNLVAVASDVYLKEADVPVLDIDDPGPLVDLIESRFLKRGEEN